MVGRLPALSHSTFLFSVFLGGSFLGGVNLVRAGGARDRARDP